ncbi:MAG: lipopolysaccharide biosynthesis protein [Acetobacteraceae bacterium]|nr:lipopolysaccharide biosynthesis protein [Acetobacteraceae bacterium]
MNSIRKSLVFSMGEKYGVYGINLIGTVVLSRLLAPHDFGVFMVGASMSTLIDSLRDFGVGSYLVQEPEITKQKVRSAFTIAMALSLLCAAGLLASAGPIADFYNEPGLARIMPFFAANFLLLPFSTPAMNLLRRELAFDALAAINLVAAAANVAIVAALAELGFGYMSFAWAALLSNLVRTAAALFYRPTFWAFAPAIVEWRTVASFGGYSSLTSLLNIFYSSLPQLILGRVLGFGAVGLYDRANKLCELPDRFIGAALQPVILPALAERVRNRGDLKGPYLRAITYMTAVQWPILVCLALLADPVVRILLGQQWAEVIPILRIIALASLWMFAAFLSYPALVAVGRVRDTFVSSIIALPPCILLTFAASFYGLEAAAATQFINLPLAVYIALRFIRRHIPFTWGEMLQAVRKSAVVALCTALGPIAMIAMAGFHFDLSIPAMALALTGSAIGWLAGLVITDHPILLELRNTALFLRHHVIARIYT